MVRVYAPQASTPIGRVCAPQASTAMGRVGIYSSYLKKKEGRVGVLSYRKKRGSVFNKCFQRLAAPLYL